ncbi:MAG: TIGR01777 family oxidoreductase [Isosphaeraceae bacterium]
MRVMITGGSGLIGRHLARSLHERGHQAVILSRHADAVRRDPAMWPFQVIPGNPTTPGHWQAEVDGCDAVVSLAGHNIFDGRWNPAIKQKIRDSRVYGASHLVAAIKQASSRPKVLVHGSAIGYYGLHGDEELDESSPSGTDFLAVVCREAEEASEPVETMGVRRAIVRTGVVLAAGDGALRVMTPLFKLGPGVPIGSGKGFVGRGAQWMSWIHVDDVVGILQLAVENEAASGPINGTAPHPVTNAEFARTFSEVLRKPHTPWRVYLPFGPPDALLKLILGEVAGVITTGQRVRPARALALGYAFKYANLSQALRAIFEPKPMAAAPAKAHAAPEARAHH